MEIIDRICAEFEGTVPSRLFYRRTRRRFNKNFCQASLVNKSWARQIRSKIFARVVIHTHDYARSFIDLCRSSALFWVNKRLNHMGAYCVEISLFQSEADCLWLHNIASLIPRSSFPALRNLSIYFELSGPDAQLPKTIYHHLPRTLPPMKSDHFFLDPHAKSPLARCTIENAVSFRSSIICDNISFHIHLKSRDLESTMQTYTSLAGPCRPITIYERPS